MKPLSLTAALLTLCLFGCQSPKRAEAPAAPSKEDSHQHAPKPAPQEVLGQFTGEGTLKKVGIKVTVDFKEGGQIEWVQEKSGKSETWGGRWRKEESDLLVLLTSPSGMIENAVFEAEGKAWKLIRYGNDQISSPDRLLISKVQH